MNRKADGSPEIVIASEFGQNLILTYKDSRFVHEAQAIEQGLSRDSEDIAIVDLDGDGDLDLVIANEDDQVNELYINNGQLRFESKHDALPFEGTSNAILAFDADADGDQDLLFGAVGQNTLLINDGRANFTVAPAGLLPEHEDATQDLEAGDIDNDGDLDIIVGNEDGNRLLINNGDGTFTAAPSESLGLGLKEETREADFADIDADGDLDLLCANVAWTGAIGIDTVRINDGAGVFSDETVTRLPGRPGNSLDIDAADLDADGDLDLVIASINQQGPTAFGGGASAVTIMLNDGAGVFTDATSDLIPASFRERVIFAIDIEIADLNDDGQLDIYVANARGVDAILIGQSS